MIMASNFLPPLPERPRSKHPWENRIKAANANKMKYAHNSISSNYEYPNITKTRLHENTTKNVEKNRFTVVGNRFTREFLYCKHLVQGLYRYKPKVFEVPVIKGFTAVDWLLKWKELVLEHKGTAYCINSPVLAVVLFNGKFLGGPEELKEHVEQIFKYDFSLNIDYSKESVKEFHKFVNSTNLYTDVVPRTCENFMRLCQKRKGGYIGTPVHRIVQDCWIQCGGFGLKDSGLTCENFTLDFDKRGVLGMANAERHVDCSTQFFIILQPAEWMNTNYVAFGQLVEGESTLKTIERSSTWYESPTQEIIIYSAGILNMECQNIRINKTALQYMSAHIENMTDFIEVLYETILDKVFEEILERCNLRRQEEDLNVLLHHKKSHMLKVPDVEANDSFVSNIFLDQSCLASDSGGRSNASTASKFLYVASLSSTETSAPVIKPERPFYFSYTDVVYPGEVDSTNDIKRLLQGKYCLEADIDRARPSTKSVLKLPKIPLDDDNLQHMMVLSPGSSSGSWDSDIEMHLNEYYRKIGERLSYSGKIIKKIAKSLKYDKLSDALESNAVIADEDLRKIKHADADLKAAMRGLKRISIDENAAREHMDRRVKRRQTGFVRGQDLKNLLSYLRNKSDSDDDDDDDDDDTMISDKLPFYLSPAEEPGPVIRPEVEQFRKSVLIRLIDDVDQRDLGGPRPTLKNYQSVLQETEPKPTPFFLHGAGCEFEAVTSEDIISGLKSRVKTRMSVAAVSSFQETYPKLHNVQDSIRTRKFAKIRPSVTIEEYRRKNRTRNVTFE